MYTSTHVPNFYLYPASPLRVCIYAVVKIKPHLAIFAWDVLRPAYKFKCSYARHLTHSVVIHQPSFGFSKAWRH